MSSNSRTAWPELPTEEWRETYATLHSWTQIVGKIRLTKSPWLNHSWHVTLYVTPRGLTTSPVPDGTRTFQIDFDFIDHRLRISTSDGVHRQFALPGHSVASFYGAIMEALAELGIAVAIDEMPNELPDPVRFSQDTAHVSYDPDAVGRLLQILVNSDRVFKQFRTGFLGKASPVHFFWGSFDLAVTRFSGRPAPANPAADQVTREAYSHEVSSVGFWPGDERLASPSFYSYAAPEPAGFRESTVAPRATYYNQTLGGFYLPYEDLRRSDDPEQTLLDYCRSTYGAAADNGKWDRKALERNATGSTH